MVAQLPDRSLDDGDADDVIVVGLAGEDADIGAPESSKLERCVPTLVELWIAWASEFIRGTAKRRRTEAEAAIAILDGLLLLRQLVGPAAANRASRTLGIAT